MSDAFVIEWDPKQDLNIVSSWISRESIYEDREIVKSFTKDVTFSIQNCHIFSKCYGLKPWLNYTNGDCYFYPIKSFHDAQFMIRLLKYVQNFQLFHWVQKLFDVTAKGEDRIKMIDKMQETHNEMLYYLSMTEKYVYTGDYHHDYVQGKDYPIKIYELDTTKEIKPCFFVRGYKMRDNNVSPYLYVMLEQKCVNNQDNNLFNFNVKFVGSHQHLPKWFSQIPILDAKQIYQQKHDDYKTRINQEYRDKICHLISSQEFSTNLQTYKRKERAWRCAWGHDCAFYVPAKERCTNPVCLGNRFYTKTVSQNRDKEYEAFCKIFGKEIGKLVRNGEFTQDKWHLIPDISNKNFIFAFDDFCKQYWYVFQPYKSAEYHINDIFDGDDYMLHKVQFIENYINHIKTWATNPNSDVVPYLYGGTVFSIPTKKPEDPKIPCMITRGTRTK